MLHLRRLPLLLALAAATVAALASPAAAHTERPIAGYSFLVGWGTEPVQVNQPNSVQLLLFKDNKPVTNLAAGKMIVHVYSQVSGDTRIQMPLDPYFEVGEWGTPGDYRAFFTPTVATGYAFHFLGTLPNGQKIDKVLADKTLFDAKAGLAVPAQPQMFPVKVASAQELTLRADREAARTSQFAAATNQAADQAAAANNRATWSLIAAAVAVLVAVMAMVVGRRRRSQQPAERSAPAHVVG